MLKVTWWRVGISLVIMASITFGLGVLLFQDNIIQFLMNPRTPFDTYTPPHRPDYKKTESWLLWPEDAEKGSADTFYIHSTTYRASHGWNAPLQAGSTRNEIRYIALPNQAGPFTQTGPIYAPYYRQATLAAFFTVKHQGRAARHLAYHDVKTAFEHFLHRRPSEKPFILVGYGQGGLHAQRLLIDYVNENADLRRHLVSAYIVDQATPHDIFTTLLNKIPLCTSADQSRCVNTFSVFDPYFEKEIWRTRNRHLVPEKNGVLSTVKNRALACVNPISWRADNIISTQAAHKGAASATGPRFGEEPIILERLISASCDNGIALVSRPRQRYLHREKHFGRKWAPLSYNLFFADIRENVENRTKTLHALLEKERHAASQKTNGN